MDFELWRRCRDEDTMVMKGGGNGGLGADTRLRSAVGSRRRNAPGTAGRVSGHTSLWGESLRQEESGLGPDLKSEGHSFLS